MKKLIFLLFVGLGTIGYGQEIIPFPDLSENHDAVYNNVETIDNLNYAYILRIIKNIYKKLIVK